MAKQHQDIDAADVPLPAEDGFEEGGLFVFDATPIIRNWPVRVKVPTFGGKFRTHEIRMDFGYVDIDGYRQLLDDVAAFIAAGGQLGESGDDEREGDPLAAIVFGWSGLASQGAGALAYSDKAKARLFADTRIRAAAAEALGRMVMGIEEKNSETPPAAGPAQPALNRAQRRAAGAKVTKGLKALKATE